MNRDTLIAAAAAALILTAPFDARAEPTAGEFFERYDKGESREGAERVMFGIFIGFAWANTYLESNARKDNPIFCEPPGSTWTSSDIIGFVREFIDKKPEFRRSPIGLALLFALRDKWPCPPS